MEYWCLVDVVIELEVSFFKEMEKENDDEENNEDCLNEFVEDIFFESDVVVYLKNGIKIRRRKNKRVIRYVGYSKKINFELYYRERLFLFLFWRNEMVDFFGDF